jgi:hypothetical protein
LVVVFHASKLKLVFLLLGLDPLDRFPERLNRPAQMVNRGPQLCRRDLDACNEPDASRQHADQLDEERP